VRHANTPSPQSVGIPHDVISQVASAGQASVQLELPVQSAAQSPSHVNAQLPVPKHAAVLPWWLAWRSRSSCDDCCRASPTRSAHACLTLVRDR